MYAIRSYYETLQADRQAASGLVGQMQAGAVQFGDAGNDPQAEPVAFGLARFGTEEALAEPGQDGLGNAGAVVADGQVVAGFAAALDGDADSAVSYNFV